MKRTHTPRRPQGRALSRRSLAVLLAAGACGLAAALAVAAEIPARPEQLQYPPLRYTPPKAADYRVFITEGL